MGEETTVRVEGCQDRLPADLTIEGIPLGEVADSVQEGPSGGRVLSYSDILRTFSLPADLYTMEDHQRLLVQLSWKFQSDQKGIRLRDSLPIDVWSRRFLEPADLSPSLLGVLRALGFPISRHVFEILLGHTTVKHMSALEDGGLWVFMQYWNLAADFFREEDGGYMAQVGYKILKALIWDVDPSRSNPAKSYLAAQGCADVGRNKKCIDGEGRVPKGGETKYVQQNPSCRHLIEDVECIARAVQKISKSDVFSGGVERLRKKKPVVTHTTLERSIRLGSFLETEAVSDPSKFPRRVSRILIVGPGLETFPPGFYISVPPQTYEPFAVANVVLHSLGGDLGTMKIDVLDINPRVTDHLASAVEAAKRGEGYTLHVPKEAQDFAGNLPGVRRESLRGIPGQRIIIPPAVVRTLRPIQGDIITDRVDEAESYDLIVILHTFMYFTEIETAIAVDNLKRLLRRGGVMITDLDPDNPEMNLSGVIEEAVFLWQKK